MTTPAMKNGKPSTLFREERVDGRGETARGAAALEAPPETSPPPASGPRTGFERRRSERKRRDFPVQVSQRAGNGRRSRWDGRALDISEQGILLDLPAPLSIGSLDLDFRLPPGLFPDSYVHRYRISGRVVRTGLPPSARASRTQRIGVEFAATLNRSLRRSRWRALRWLGVLLFLAALANIVLLKLQNIEFFWHSLILNLYSLGVTTYILSRFLIAAFYRPPPATDHQPAVSVIVSAKNEEAAIAETLERILGSDYPRDFLEVIAVDDGSTDRTYQEMERVRQGHPQLRLIRFPQNRGKRHGMASGALAAKGEILVYVDSDSFLEKDALRYLVQGFADPGVGAVAAQGLVANSWKNGLTRMQAVRYYVAFTVLKAAESVFSSVTCCSGCCAAYRRSAVLEVLDVWLSQQFMGRPATFGDDRSLTNFMLRKHKVIYDDRARVHTLVPETYRQFFRQQLRWKKSWVRESLIATSFIWKKPPVMVASFFAGLLFPLISPFVVLRALVYLPAVTHEPSFLYAWGVLLMSLLYSAYYLIRQRNRLWVYGIYFCILYLFVLTWQLPWAIATSWNNKWGTR